MWLYGLIINNLSKALALVNMHSGMARQGMARANLAKTQVLSITVLPVIQYPNCSIYFELKAHNNVIKIAGFACTLKIIKLSWNSGGVQVTLKCKKSSRAA